MFLKGPPVRDTFSSMPVAAKKSKSSRLVARITTAEKRLLARAAATEGRTVVSFVLSHARAAAERIVGQGNVIRLDEVESRRFVDALLAPPAPPTKRMRQALGRYHQQVVEV